MTHPTNKHEPHKSYIVSVGGPGLHIEIEIQGEDDLKIVEQMIEEIRRKVGKPGNNYRRQFQPLQPPPIKRLDNPYTPTPMPVKPDVPF